MKKNLLMIGVSRVILKKLSEDDDIDVYAIEEEEIYRRHNLDKFKPVWLKKVILAKYIDSEEYVDVVKELAKEVKFDGILAARDYAVRAMGKAGEIIKVPTLGAENAKKLTNKYLLRKACEKHNIPHPRFKKIDTKEELEEFFKGKPVIFKPATLQGSLGISKINQKSDIDWAWKNTTETYDEKAAVSRDIMRENIAEEFIGGFEVSVETLVRDGEIVFNNITRKLTFEDSCVEKGHTVPSCLPEEIEKRIFNEKKNFVKSLNIECGILHSEWKIENEKPVLIECAGRIPGDRIHELITLSYGFTFLKELCNLAVGNEININTKPKKVSSVRYFEAKPGILKRIEGTEILNMPEVKEWEITVNEGDKISKVASSWDRIGFFVITADDINELREKEKKVLDTVKFIVE